MAAEIGIPRLCEERAHLRVPQLGRCAACRELAHLNLVLSLTQAVVKLANPPRVVGAALVPHA